MVDAKKAKQRTLFTGWMKLNQSALVWRIAPATAALLFLLGCLFFPQYLNNSLFFGIVATAVVAQIPVVVMEKLGKMRLVPFKGKTFKWVGRVINTAFCLAVFFAVLFYGYSPNYVYYHEITEINGIVTGQGSPVNAGTAKSIPGVWRVTTRRFSQDVTAEFVMEGYDYATVNSYSKLYNYSLFRPHVKIVCQVRHGEIQSTTYYSSKNKKSLEINYNSKKNAEVRAWSDDNCTQLLGSTLFRSSGDEALNSSGVTYLDIEYNDDGTPKSRILMSRDKNKRMYTTNGEYGEVYEYTDGWLTKITYLGPDPKDPNKLIAVPDRLGIQSISLSYQEGRLSCVRYLAEGDKPTAGFHQVAQEVYLYRYGSLSEIQFQNENASSVYNGDGIAVCSIEPKPLDGVLEEKYFADDGNNLTTEKTSGAAMLRLQNKGKTLTVSYFDKQGNPTYNKVGKYAQVATVVDQNSNQVEHRFYDVAGKAILSDSNGAAREKIKYDNNGKWVRQSFYDTAGKPVLTKDLAVASIKASYEGSNQVELSYYGKDNKLILRKDRGYAVMRKEYNEKGFCDKELFYDTKRKLTPRSDWGCSIREMQYDEKGNVERFSFKVEVAMTDASGKPVNVEQPVLTKNGGYASIFRVFGSKGEMLQEQYFGTDNKPVLERNSGCAAWKAQYNADGSMKSKAYYAPILEGHADKFMPILEKVTGCARWEAEYLKGQMVRKDFYDTNDAHILTKDVGCAYWISEYNDKGNETKTTYFDSNDQPALRKGNGYATVKKEYTEKGDIWREQYFLDEDYNKPAVMLGDVGVEMREWKYNDRGFLENIFYKNAAGELAINGEGYAIAEYRYYENGQKSGNYYWAAPNQPALSKSGGYASYSIGYDNRGNENEYRYYGINGEPTLKKNGGYARLKKEYDERGNWQREYYFGVEEQPVLHSNYGYASVANTYERDQIVRQDYFGTEENTPILSKDGGYSTLVKKYNEFGLCVEKSYYNGEEPALNSNGAFRITYLYDKRRNVTDAAYFDANDNPAINKEYGFSRIKYDYDKNDNLKIESYFATNSEGVESASLLKNGGYSSLTYEYDPRGNNITKLYFREENGATVPAFDKASGSAVIRFGFTPQDWKERTEYYQDETNPTLHKDTGCAVVASVYDKMGNETQISYYGIDQETLILNKKSGCAVIRREYNGYGRETSTEYLGVDELPTLRSDTGVAYEKKDYDERGYCNLEEYYGVDKTTKTLHKETGVAAVKSWYDGRGNQEEYLYLGVDGKPVPNKNNGITRCKITHYPNDAWKTERYFDAQDNPVVRSDIGVAEMRALWDPRGNLQEQQYYGIDGGLAATKDYGYAVVAYQYNPLDNMIQESYLDQNRKLVNDRKNGYAVSRKSYDSRGNTQSGSFYDKDGITPILCKQEGYAKYKCIYDKFDRPTERSYFDTNGLPIYNKEKMFATIKMDYDPRGNEITEEYLAPDGSPAYYKNYGYCKLKRNYNEGDQIVSVRFLDAQGDPTFDSDNGSAGYDCKYDLRGNRVETTYYDAGGSNVGAQNRDYAVLRVDYNQKDLKQRQGYYQPDGVTLLDSTQEGCAYIKYEYDALGSLTQKSYFDSANQPVAVNGFAGLKVVYDYPKREKTTTYLNVKGKPVVVEDKGFASYQEVSDAVGNVISTRYYGIDGKTTAMHLKQGYSMITFEYDGSLKTLEKYYDVNEKPTESFENGCTQTKYSYNEYGSRVQTIFLDEQGNKIKTKKGYAVEKLTYDDLGRVEYVRYYDADGITPAINEQWNCYAYQNEYNTRGDREKLVYLDANGKPTIRKDIGYAWEEYIYDDKDRLIKELYYTEDGTLTVPQNGDHFGKKYRYDDLGKLIDTVYLTIEDVEPEE